MSHFAIFEDVKYIFFLLNLIMLLAQIIMHHFATLN
jgi:hypothetical protein